MSTRSPVEELRVALEVVAGRTPQGAAPDATWLAHAGHLREVRRRVLVAEACPTPVLRRAQALFAGRAQRSLVRLLRMAFDSWSLDSRATPARAHRGAGSARTLRFEGEGVALDVRVSRRREGGALIQVALDPPMERTDVTVTPRGSSRGRRVPLDASGVGQVALTPSARYVVLTVRERGSDRFRTPSIELEA